MPDAVRLAAFGAYVVTAVLGWSAARRASARERTAWLITAAMLFLLGAAKLIQLQSAITDAVRNTVSAHGWYAEHRELQAIAVLVVAIGATVVAVSAARWLRSAAPGARLGLGVAGLLCLFGVIRAASIHAVDLWVTAPLFGLKRGWWIELAGLLAIASAALNYRARSSAIPEE